jgi:hypothetical protein
MILLLTVLAALLAVPIVLQRRAAIAGWSLPRLVIAWVLAVLPTVLVFWMVSSSIGRDWAVALPGGERVVFVLFNLGLLLLLLLVVGLPAAMLTATAIWIRAWQAKQDAARMGG